MPELYVGYQTLFMIEFQNQISGVDNVTEDDVLTFFQFQISAVRARNILRELYLRGYVSRTKEKRKKKRGPRRYLYHISKRGIERCEYMRSLGYSLEKE